MSFESDACNYCIMACMFLTFTYVGSLYVWRSKLSRDHPSTIKRRFFSVACMMLLTPFYIRMFLSKETQDHSVMLQHMGLRSEAIFTAIFGPLFLTAALFLGPLTMQFFSGFWKLYAEPLYWLASWQDLVWVRNHFMAPLSEEWVFRACMMPLLLQCFHKWKAIVVGPLLFGIAHFHHMYEQINAGVSWKTALCVSVFQFVYTSIFGIYSAFLFVRTGHFLAPLVVHMFCNHMGFPNFAEIFQYPAMHRVVIAFNFLLGFGLWCLLLNPLTNPDIYDNRIHWET